MVQRKIITVGGLGGTDLVIHLGTATPDADLGCCQCLSQHTQQNNDVGEVDQPAVRDNERDIIIVIRGDEADKGRNG